MAEQITLEMVWKYRSDYGLPDEDLLVDSPFVQETSGGKKLWNVRLGITDKELICMRFVYDCMVCRVSPSSMPCLLFTLIPKKSLIINKLQRRRLQLLFSTVWYFFKFSGCGSAWRRWRFLTEKYEKGNCLSDSSPNQVKLIHSVHLKVSFRNKSSLASDREALKGFYASRSIHRKTDAEEQRQSLSGMAVPNLSGSSLFSVSTECAPLSIKDSESSWSEESALISPVASPNAACEVDLPPMKREKFPSLDEEPMSFRRVIHRFGKGIPEGCIFELTMSHHDERFLKGKKITSPRCPRLKEKLPLNLRKKTASAMADKSERRFSLRTETMERFAELSTQTTILEMPDQSRSKWSLDVQADHRRQLKYPINSYSKNDLEVNDAVVAIAKSSPFYPQVEIGTALWLKSRQGSLAHLRRWNSEGALEKGLKSHRKSESVVGPGETKFLVRNESLPDLNEMTVTDSSYEKYSLLEMFSRRGLSSVSCWLESDSCSSYPIAFWMYDDDMRHQGTMFSSDLHFAKRLALTRKMQLLSSSNCRSHCHFATTSAKVHHRNYSSIRFSKHMRQKRSSDSGLKKPPLRSSAKWCTHCLGSSEANWCRSLQNGARSSTVPEPEEKGSIFRQTDYVSKVWTSGQEKNFRQGLRKNSSTPSPAVKNYQPHKSTNPGFPADHWICRPLLQQKTPKASCGLHDLNPQALAQELTLIDQKLFLSVRPEEIVRLIINPKTVTEFTSPHLCSYVQFFARINALVTSEILRNRSPGERAQVLAIFAEVALRCQEMRNNQSACALLCGITSPVVLRMMATWCRFQTEYPDHCRSLQRMLNIFNEKVRRNEGHTSTPSLPFFGSFLRGFLVSPTSCVGFSQRFSNKISSRKKWTDPPNLSEWIEENSRFLTCHSSHSCHRKAKDRSKISELLLRVLGECSNRNQISRKAYLQCTKPKSTPKCIFLPQELGTPGIPAYDRLKKAVTEMLRTVHNMCTGYNMPHNKKARSYLLYTRYNNEEYNVRLSHSLEPTTMQR